MTEAVFVASIVIEVIALLYFLVLVFLCYKGPAVIVITVVFIIALITIVLLIEV
jgi:hypothetical protein